MKPLIFLMVLPLMLGAMPPGKAVMCRTTEQHTICIMDIQRSAKNYWEYRVAVRVDGVDRPLERYNCRDRTRQRQDGRLVPFEPGGAGDVICKLFKR